MSDCPHNENNTDYCSICLRAEIERLEVKAERSRVILDIAYERCMKAEDRVAELEERIEKLLASKFAASSPKLIAKIITRASEGET